MLLPEVVRQSPSAIGEVEKVAVAVLGERE